MAILLALITYFGWGSGDIFGAYATRKVGAYLTTFFVFIFGFMVASFYTPFAINDLHKITLGMFLLNVLLGIFVLFGNFLLNEAFKRSNVSVVGVIVQSFPAVVLVLSALIFKDQVTSQQMVWIALIFLGMFLCVVNFSDFRKGKTIVDRGITYALIAAAIFSIYFTFMRVFIDAYGWFWPNYIAIASFPLTLILVRWLFHIKEKVVFPKKKSVLAATFLSALLLRGGDVALNYGISSGFASIVAPISGASPTLFVTLSWLIFRDKINQQQKIGIGICLLGIVLLSFFGK